MIQTGHWERGDNLNRSHLLQLLQKKFAAMDFEQAKGDVRPFLKDKDELVLWSRDFFLEVIETLEVI